jgi:hypothetical protein
MRTTFTNHLTAAEYHLALRTLQRQSAARMPLRHLMTLLQVTFGIASGIAIVNLLTAGGLPRDFRQAVVAMFFVAFIGATWIGLRGLRRLAAASVGRLHDSQGTLEIGDDGIDLHGAKGGSFTRWSAIEGVDEVNGVLLLRLDDLRALIVSGTAFNDPGERAAFVSFARTRIAAQQQDVQQDTAAPAKLDVEAAPGSIASHAHPAAVATTPAVGDRLRDALRLAFLRPVAMERLQAGWGEILAAAVLTFLIPTLFGFIDQGTEGTFDPQHLPQVVVVFAMAAITAAAIGITTRRREVVAPVLFATLLAWIAIDLVASVAYTIAVEAGDLPRFFHQVFVIAPFIWLAAAVARFAVPLHDSPTARRALTAACAWVLLALPLAYVAPDRSLWVKDWSRDARMAQRDDARKSVTAEAAWYAQPDILARELDAVQPGRDGVVDLYFVGMAGYGSQDVFMREVDAVSRLMRERFDADGRVVRLVNNSKTLFDAPIASLTSLRRALKRVAERMNVEEDVAVIFLTSHGSEDHRFSLQLWPLRFDDLDPKALKQALDESGIRNRVVIVSACYSGGFARPLADERTLVITASAPDRNSFGCSNEAEWTYFGRAYFDEALRGTHSFTDAFRRALPVIARREAAEQFTPSNPTMAGGEALGGPLKRLEARLSQATATAAREPAPQLR